MGESFQFWPRCGTLFAGDRACGGMEKERTVMRRNACLTALLLASALFCAACGARMPAGEENTGGTDQTLPVTGTLPERTEPAGTTEPQGTEEPGGTETPEAGQLPGEPDAVDGGAEDPDAQPEEAEEVPDLSGWYRDMQGTDVIYSELILSRQEEGNGLYDASIGLYRLTTLEGIAQVQEDGTLFFIGGPPKVQAVITIDGEQAAVEFTVSEFEYIEPGDVFTFPDGKA